MNDEFEYQTIELPIDGVLDLHTFSPKDVKDLVITYIDECLKKGITDIEIIHGKGKGVLREIVHSILGCHPNVISYSYGKTWGSTLAKLGTKKDAS